MSIFKKVVIIALFIVWTVVVGVLSFVAGAFFGSSDEISNAVQEQRFEDMFERERLEDVRCSKMSKNKDSRRCAHNP